MLHKELGEINEGFEICRTIKSKHSVLLVVKTIMGGAIVGSAPFPAGLSLNLPGENINQSVEIATGPKEIVQLPNEIIP